MARVSRLLLILNIREPLLRRVVCSDQLADQRLHLLPPKPRHAGFQVRPHRTAAHQHLPQPLRTQLVANISQ